MLPKWRGHALSGCVILDANIKIRWSSLLLPPIVANVELQKSFVSVVLKYKEGISKEVLFAIFLIWSVLCWTSYLSKLKLENRKD